MEITLILSIAALALAGPLAGMSIDQSIKQLPARRSIGSSAYSAYMRAADLANGRYLYAFFGLGAAVAAVAAAIGSHVSHVGGSAELPLDISAALAMLHSGTTAFAAPIAFRQQNLQLTNESALTRVLDRFERWQTARMLLQVSNFGVAIWAVVGLVRSI